MKLANLIVIISLSLTLAFCHQQFNNYLNPWNSLVTIEGEFDKNHTVIFQLIKLFKQSICDPCDYMIVVYRDYVQLLIDNPQEGKTINVFAYEFMILEDHYDEKLWDFDRHKFTLQKKRDIQELIERTSNKGLQWSYELTLPIEGLIIKGHTQYLYQNLIPLVSFIFSILIFITFPFSGEGRREQSIQIPRRTPLISLLILTHLQHLIFIQVVVLMFKYLIYEESFLTKSFWYVVFMIPFAFIVLQIVYMYDAIRCRYVKTLENVGSARLRDVGLVLTFLVGIYGGSIALLLVGKGLWVFTYFSFYLVWQIMESLFTKVYPYLPMTGYYFSLVAFQMFLANFEPLFGFQQHTWAEIAIFWGILLAIFIVGSILQKFFIGIEMVNQVLFEESKSIQMGHHDSAKSTEANLQT